MNDDINSQARDNEIVKYFSASLDRLSTAAVVVGFIGPAAALMSNPEVSLSYDSRRWIFVVVSSVYWLAAAYGLHITGRATLARGFR
ncbi:hypothetical protein LJR231_003887 [Phyllobacterium sp. LjRoot231]|uniref:hypothetical protein n=1 Tax=Phyllobacterium sp. LjRoot231 TaxID=3342289 RepID=UPI003ECC9BBE